MSENDRKSLIAMITVILIGAGVAFAGSQNSVQAFGLPLYGLSVAIIFLIQWLAFIPAYAQRTETFFDLTGSLTYIGVTLFMFLMSPAKDARSIILVLLVGIWAGRLGTFLYQRVHKAGKDGRFDEIKKSFWRFLNVWSIQGLWVTFTAAAAHMAITSNTRVDLGIWAIAGIIVWVIGFAIEVMADNQKTAFRADPANEGKFIQSGLWARSRHPNYFGEIVLWAGVMLIAVPVLQGWQWVAVISPIFVTLLLTRVSGVPMLEARADKKWGGQPDYEAYKENTPVLIPKIN